MRELKINYLIREKISSTVFPRMRVMLSQHFDFQGLPRTLNARRPQAKQPTPSYVRQKAGLRRERCKPTRTTKAFYT